MKRMKKIKALLAVLVIISIVAVFSALSACKSADTDSKTAESQEAAATTKVSETTQAAEESNQDTQSSDQPQKLTMWWWGEQEIAGMTGWIDNVIKAFEQENPGVTIEANLQATENLMSDFPTAAAAGKAPDIQFMWPGVYSIDWVYLGYLAPLNEIMPADELSHIITKSPVEVQEFDGNVYRYPLYAFGFGWFYNKSLFAQAGISADMMPPQTWEDFLTVCETLKKAGITPIAFGSKDGLVGDWIEGSLLYQQFDQFSDAMQLGSGELKWTDPKYFDYWVKLKELWDKGYINDDVNSLDMYQGTEIFTNGKAAMTLGVGAQAGSITKALGAENVGFMIPPVAASNKLAGTPVYDANGYGISADSPNKELAGKFLQFMHKTEFLNALYTDLGGIPADDRFDTSVVNDDLTKQQIEWIKNGNPYINNVFPVDITYGTAYVGSQKLFAGETTPEAMGQEAERLAIDWRDQNPDILEKYQTWMESFKN